MAKSDFWGKQAAATKATTAGLHKQDRKLAEARNREQYEQTELRLDLIQARPHGDARPLDDNHVVALANSIKVLGLIQPIAVDRQGRLVAGGHRLAAMKFLQEKRPEVFLQRFPDGLIPVRMLSDLDAETDPVGARLAEFEENEKRKGMTKQQVIALADVLRSQGFRFVDGRPKKGEQSGLQALALASDKHLVTVHRWLKEVREESGNVSNANVSSPSKVAVKRLQKAAAACRDAISASGKTDGAEERVLKILAELEHALVDWEQGAPQDRKRTRKV